MIKINGDTNNKDLEDIPEIKRYFSKIYTVLSKDIRDKKKKKIRKELAYLPKKKQYEYLDELE